MELWEGKGGFRLALMGRLNTGHVSACARELDLIDLPDSGLGAKENHLSNVHLGTFQTLLPKNLFFFSGEGSLQKKGCDPNNNETFNAYA